MAAEAKPPPAEPAAPVLRPEGSMGSCNLCSRDRTLQIIRERFPRFTVETTLKFTPVRCGVGFASNIGK